MRKFQVGKKYKVASICDQNCIWTFEIVARTEKTITISDGKKEKKCRIIKKISEYRDSESVYPLGKYAMCPILSA